MRADGDHQYIGVIVEYDGPYAIRDVPIKDIDQVMIDNCASATYPNAPAATAQPEFLHAGFSGVEASRQQMTVNRPVGWRGKKTAELAGAGAALPLLDNCYAIDQEFGLLCLTLPLHRGTD